MLSKVIAIGSASLALVGVLAVLWLSHDLKNVRLDRDTWKVAALTWQKAAEDYKRAFHRSEDLREAEDSQAVTAINQANAFCNKRVAQARKAAFSLSSLLNKEPKRDPTGCPVRTLLDPNELRESLDAAPG